MPLDDDLWDDLFHGCAWHAYLEIVHRTGKFPPDPEQTRRRACELFEQQLKAKSSR